LALSRRGALASEQAELTRRPCGTVRFLTFSEQACAFGEAATALGEMKAKQGRVGRFQHDDSIVAFCGDDNYMVRRITNAWERWLSWSLPTKIGIIGTVASVLSVALYIWDLKPFLEHRFEKPAQKGE
jgi:hypothetical protein